MCTRSPTLHSIRFDPPAAHPAPPPSVRHSIPPTIHPIRPGKKDETSAFLAILYIYTQRERRACRLHHTHPVTSIRGAQSRRRWFVPFVLRQVCRRHIYSAELLVRRRGRALWLSMDFVRRHSVRAGAGAAGASQCIPQAGWFCAPSCMYINVFYRGMPGY